MMSVENGTRSAGGTTTTTTTRVTVRSTSSCLASKSCILGMLICLALLALLFGIDAISRDFRNDREHIETSAYIYNATCYVHSESLRSGRTAGGGSCEYASYILTFTPATTAYYVPALVNASASSSGSPAVYDYSTAPGTQLFPDAVEDDFGSLRQAYSNFFDRTCGGVFPAVNSSSTTVDGLVSIECWFSDPKDFTLRISPIYQRDLTFRIYGVCLLLVGGGPLVVFVCYNCFLCCFACIRYSGREEAEHQAQLERQRMARREQAVQAASSNEPIRSDPYEIPDADDIDREEREDAAAQVQREGDGEVSSSPPSSWKDRFTGNAYASLIIQRLDRIRDWRRSREELREQQRDAARLKKLYGEAGLPAEDGSERSVPDSQQLSVVVPTSLGPTPRGGDNGGGDDLPAIDECQVCLDTITAAVVVYPCGHYFCDDCVMRLLVRNYQGYSTVAKCPVCRLEHPDDQVVRVRMSDNTRTPAVATGRMMSGMPSPLANRDEEGELSAVPPPHQQNGSDPFGTTSRTPLDSQRSSDDVSVGGRNAATPQWLTVGEHGATRSSSAVMYF